MTKLGDGVDTYWIIDDVDNLPFPFILDGLPAYPRYAAEDFERAFLRFCILIGEEEPFGDLQERRRANDVLSFPEIASAGDVAGYSIMPEERALDFVVKVTGYPHGWVASWNYRVALNDIARDAAGEERQFSQASRSAYADAVRYAARDRTAFEQA